MSERSVQLPARHAPADAGSPVDSISLPIIPQVISQAKKQHKLKPRFAEFACSHVEVGVCFWLPLSTG